MPKCGGCAWLFEWHRFGWQILVLLTNSQVDGWQLVHLRARTWLGKQMRSIIIKWRQWGMAVGVHWVPTGLRPADLPSWLDAEAGSSKLQALLMALERSRCVYGELPALNVRGACTVNCRG